MLSDDDTFVAPGHVHALVQSLDPGKATLYGQMECDFFCGGGGGLVSPAMLRALRKQYVLWANGAAYDLVLSHFSKDHRLGELVQHDGFRSQAPAFYRNEGQRPVPERPMTFHYVPWIEGSRSPQRKCITARCAPACTCLSGTSIYVLQRRECAGSTMARASSRRPACNTSFFAVFFLLSSFSILLLFSLPFLLNLTLLFSSCLSPLWIVSGRKPLPYSIAEVLGGSPSFPLLFFLHHVGAISVAPRRWGRASRVRPATRHGAREMWKLKPPFCSGGTSVWATATTRTWPPCLCEEIVFTDTSINFRFRKMQRRECVVTTACSFCPLV